MTKCAIIITLKRERYFCKDDIDASDGEELKTVIDRSHGEN